MVLQLDVMVWGGVLAPASIFNLVEAIEPLLPRGVEFCTESPPPTPPRAARDSSAVALIWCLVGS
jgi:hypothetical protein